MEAEERPKKLRKLSHDVASAVTAADGSTLVTTELSKSNAPTGSLREGDHSSHDPILTEATTIGMDGSHGDESTLATDSTTAPSPLSKNQLKKLKRRAEWEAGREDRKIKRKEKTKEKKARKREAQAEKDQDLNKHAPEGTESPVAKQNQSNGGSLPRRRRQRLPISFVIDCGFDNLMVEKEIISLGSQLTRSYSDNSKSLFQAHLYVSDWKPATELRKRFEGLMRGMYRNWKGIKFIEEDFAVASEMSQADMVGENGGRMVGVFEKYAHLNPSPANGKRKGNAALKPQVHDISGTSGDAVSAVSTDQTGEDVSPSLQSLQDAGEVIYLTSDSPYTLTELKPYHTYIVGGIVDKNRHKGICYKAALDKNVETASQQHSDSMPVTRKWKDIKTAKLPIGEYMSMTARHVLATNHVIEIMLKWLETGDWGEAFLSVMPKRKGGVLKSTSDGVRRDSPQTCTHDDADDGDDPAAEEQQSVSADDENQAQDIGEEIGTDP